jgi:single-strand DNA-binding protein
VSSLNLVQLIGNLGADPELRQTTGGTPVCNLRLATTEKWTDKEGQAQEKTEWHRVVVWGKTAEFCGRFLARGKQVYVEGSIETRKWTDKEGVEKYSTEIKASRVLFLGKKDDAAPAAADAGEEDPETGYKRHPPGPRKPPRNRDLDLPF